MVAYKRPMYWTQTAISRFDDVLRGSSDYLFFGVDGELVLFSAVHTKCRLLEQPSGTSPPVPTNQRMKGASSWVAGDFNQHYPEACYKKVRTFFFRAGGFFQSFGRMTLLFN